MNFTTIYEDRLKFFPEKIDIADGKKIKETNGFLFFNLSQIWNNAQTLTRSQAEDYFVWAYFKVLHRKAKKDFKNKKVLTKTTEIEKSKLEKEYKNVIQEAEKINIKAYCCKMMKSQLKHKCKMHDSKYDCPDTLIDYLNENETYILIIHDGGASGIEIKYCPWCSTKL
jgi:hypothetical protein